MTKKEALGSAATLAGLGVGAFGAMQSFDQGAWLVGAALLVTALALLVAGYRLLLSRTETTSLELAEAARSPADAGVKPRAARAAGPGAAAGRGPARRAAPAHVTPEGPAGASVEPGPPDTPPPGKASRAAGGESRV